VAESSTEIFELDMKNLKNREDVVVWRDRLIGKRLVTSHPGWAAHEAWKSANVAEWEPRMYLCKPIREGFEQTLKYDVQTASRFLMLPAELRNRILEFVLPPQQILNDAENDRIDPRDAPWMNTSAIIFCCKQLYAEGRTLAMEQHTFQLEKFPRKTRFCAPERENEHYNWKV
jgi:hypothetical protein